MMNQFQATQEATHAEVARLAAALKPKLEIENTKDLIQHMMNEVEMTGRLDKDFYDRLIRNLDIYPNLKSAINAVGQISDEQASL